MLNFYKSTALSFFALVLLTAAWVWLCNSKMELVHELLPADSSTIPWHFHALTDIEKGGSSSIQINDSEQTINYTYVLTDKITYPHATVFIAFDLLNNAAHYVDLRRYSKAAYKLKCNPENILSLHLHTFDPKVTQVSNLSSFRISESFGHCGEQWTEIEVDLHHLNVPAWWLNQFALNNSEQSYQLEQVLAFSIGASKQGPINTPAQVSVHRLTLYGQDTRWFWLALFVTVILWFSAITVMLRAYTKALTKDVRKRMKQSLPLLAFKDISIEPLKENSQLTILLRFIATAYNIPEISLEYTSAKTGIDRNTINRLMRAELGLTFNAYVTKLRMVEAARILQCEGDIQVTELVYKLGFKSVAHFYKLFKDEYGCSPNKFKTIQTEALTR